MKIVVTCISLERKQCLYCGAKDQIQSVKVIMLEGERTHVSQLPGQVRCVHVGCGLLCFL